MAEQQKRIVNVFVSSAIDELRYEREVAERTLRQLSIEPLMFEILPSMSRSAREAYREAVAGCDIFTIILGAKLRDAVKEEYGLAVELRKPILALVRSLRYPEKRDKTLDSFLSDLQYKWADYATLQDLEEALKTSVMTELASSYVQAPRISRTRSQMYIDAADLVSYAKTQLYVYQETPSQIFGPRPYDEPSQKIDFELVFYGRLESWLSGAARKESKRKFMLLFHPGKTKEEMQKYGLADNVKAEITRIKSLEIESGGSVILAVLDHETCCV